MPMTSGGGRKKKKGKLEGRDEEEFLSRGQGEKGGTPPCLRTLKEKKEKKLREECATSDWDTAEKTTRTTVFSFERKREKERKKRGRKDVAIHQRVPEEKRERKKDNLGTRERRVNAFASVAVCQQPKGPFVVYEQAWGGQKEREEKLEKEKKGKSQSITLPNGSYRKKKALAAIASCNDVVATEKGRGSSVKRGGSGSNGSISLNNNNGGRCRSPSVFWLGKKKEEKRKKRSRGGNRPQSAMQATGLFFLLFFEGGRGGRLSRGEKRDGLGFCRSLGKKRRGKKSVGV